MVAAGTSGSTSRSARPELLADGFRIPGCSHAPVHAVQQPLNGLVRHLRNRRVDIGRDLRIEPVVLDVANDADDARAARSATILDDQVLTDRVRDRPVALCECPADQHHRLRPGIVMFVQRSSRNQRHAEGPYVRWTDHSVLCVGAARGRRLRTIGGPDVRSRAKTIERDDVDGGGVLDTWNREELRPQRVDEARRVLGARVPPARKREARGQQVIAAEAGIDGLQAREALREDHRNGDQHRGERNLGDDQPAPQGAGRPGRGARAAQRGGSGAEPPDRHRCEDRGRRDRGRDREQQDARIEDAGRRDGQEIRRRKSGQRACDDAVQQQAGGAGGERDQQRLEDHLTHPPGA
jgi:hypothetical protein